MDTIIVVLEMEPATEVLDDRVDHRGEVDIGARVRFVHAARPDPGAPGDLPARTVCGLDTTALEPQAYTPAWPGGPWYPPEYRTRRCPHCETALSPA